MASGSIAVSSNECARRSLQFRATSGRMSSFEASRSPTSYNLNALLGAAIEAGVVSTLNSLRPLWDGDDRYAMYSFVRQPQTFPDVRLMSHKRSARVTTSEFPHPYPSKTDEILDKAEDDAGRNFGRIARTGLMDTFCEAAGERLLSGIPARYWRQFFKTFTETATADTTEAMLDRFAKDIGRTWDADHPDRENVIEVLRQVARSLGAR